MKWKQKIMFLNNLFKFKKIIILIIFTLICNILFSIKNSENKIVSNPVELSLIAISTAITEINTKKNNYIGNQNVFFALKNSEAYIKYKKCKESNKNCVLSNVNLKNPSKISEHDYNFKKLYYERENVGLIDFYKLSLIIFGNDINSFTFFYLTILSVSALIFCFRFCNEEMSLLIVSNFLFCHLIYTFMLPSLDQELLVIYNRRSLTILTIIPSIHILITIFKRKLLSNIEIVFLFIQLFLLYLIIHFRSSANYQIIFLITCCAFLLIKERFNYKFYLNLRVPIIFVMSSILFFSFSFYYKKTVNLDPIYSIKRASHFFWHPIYVGLSSHPDSEIKYDIDNNDSTSFRYVEKKSEELHQNKNWQIYYSNNDFDKLLKEKIINIFASDPLFFFQAYFYKMKNLIEIIFNELIMKQFHYIIYATFFSIIAWIISTNIKDKINRYKYFNRSLLFLAICTTIPSLFAIPKIVYIIDTIVILFMIFIFFCIKIINLVNVNYLNKRKGYAKFK